MTKDSEAANARRALAEVREQIATMPSAHPKTIQDKARAARITTSRRYFVIQERHWQPCDGVFQGPYARLAKLKAGGFLDAHRPLLDHDTVLLATRAGEPYLLIESEGCHVHTIRRYLPRTDGKQSHHDLTEYIAHTILY